MPLSAINLQWSNHNSQRSYPLADWGSAVDKSGTIRIPDSFLVGLYLPIHAWTNIFPEKFYIQSLTVSPVVYGITIGYDDGTIAPPLVAGIHFARASHTPYLSYALNGAGAFDDVVGRVAFGPLDDIDQLPPGVYTFDPAATPLETDSINPVIRGVSSLTVVNGSDRSPRIYGDVELVAGTNMRIVASLTDGQPPQITFSAISGEGLNEACACEEVADGPAIRFINGIPPLPDGNFRVVGNRCMDIQPAQNGLRFSDLCSEPCCGCEELTALTRQIDRFADGAATLQNFVTRVGGEVAQMNQVVLGSRLGDSGCIEC